MDSAIIIAPASPLLSEKVVNICAPLFDFETFADTLVTNVFVEALSMLQFGTAENMEWAWTSTFSNPTTMITVSESFTEMKTGKPRRDSGYEATVAQDDSRPSIFVQNYTNGSDQDHNNDNEIPIEVKEPVLSQQHLQPVTSKRDSLFEEKTDSGVAVSPSRSYVPEETNLTSPTHQNDEDAVEDAVDSEKHLYQFSLRWYCENYSV